MRATNTLFITIAVAAPMPALAQQTDLTDTVEIQAAALAAVRHEFPVGRIVLDRVIVDTSSRMALPLASQREHRAPEAWTKGLGIETANSEYLRKICLDGIIGCRLPENISVVVGLSQAVVRGDTAKVIVRFSENTGAVAHGVRTTVEEMTIVRDGRDWELRDRRVRAVG
jgi:hypothetical protein